MLNKSEIKAAVIHDLGIKLDDDREKTVADFHRAGGGVEALQRCANAVNDLKKYIDQDLEAGKLPKFTEPLEVAEYMKDWITRAAGCAISMGKMYDNHKLKHEGGLNTYDAILGMISKQHAVAEAKAARIREAADMQVDMIDQSDAPRMSGIRPAPGIKAQRQAATEAAEALKTAAIETKAEAPPEEPEPDAPAQPEEPEAEAPPEEPELAEEESAPEAPAQTPEPMQDRTAMTRKNKRAAKKKTRG
jgi:hypothetical protein